MRLIFLLVGVLLIDGVLLFTIVSEPTPAHVSHSKHALKIIFLSLVALLTIFAIVRFGKKENRELEKPDELDEDLSLAENALLLIFVVGGFGISYAADQYIYQPCGMPFAGKWDTNVRPLLYLFFVLIVAAGLVIGKVRWFSSYAGWLLTAAITTVLTVITLVVRFWCY